MLQYYTLRCIAVCKFAECHSPLFHVAVGSARVVDEAGYVASVASVDYHTVADLKQSVGEERGTGWEMRDTRKKRDRMSKVGSTEW